ncbi:MAG: LysR family transcriptional regulator [Thermaerobacter sp.]|nr:LysR family transcriptional regulator [Thermaerobacter sp.]
MDTTALRTFVVAARAGSFRRAAALRYLSQATVTQQIQRLEAELGTPLFDRSGRAVRLSAAGSAFLPRAERVLRELAAAQADLGEGRPAPLRIAAAPHIARVFLPSLLARAAAPERWALSVLSSTDVPEAVRTGEADVGLARFRPLPLDLQSIFLYEDDLLLITAHDGLDLDREPPDPADLLGRLPLFTYGPGATWIAVEEALRRAGLPAPRLMHVAQIDIAKQFVLGGFGVAILPNAAVRTELAFGSVLAVPLLGIALPKDGVYAILPAEPSPAAQQFVQRAGTWFLGRRTGHHGT